MKSLLAILLISRLPAQVLGAIETFSDADNADSWNFYDYADEVVDAPEYILPGSTDPEIFTRFTNDNGVSLFATDVSSSGWFTGDFTDAGIGEIACDVYIEDPTTFDVFEFYIVANNTFYYSNGFTVSNQGWSFAEVNFLKDDWYLSVNNELVLTSLTPALLADVTEIGINYFPIPDSASNGRIVGLDNFNLLPDLTPVVPEIAVSGSELKLSFEALAGIQYSIQESPSLLENSWMNTEAPFVNPGGIERTLPVSEKNFFRVLIDPLVIDTPSS